MTKKVFLKQTRCFNMTVFQLFWEKRLEGLRASDANGNPLEPMELPNVLRPAGPNVADETLLQSVATALHVLGQPITGQANLKPGLDKNPAVFINPDQPLMQVRLNQVTSQCINENRYNLRRRLPNNRIDLLCCPI